MSEKKFTPSEFLQKPIFKAKWWRKKIENSIDGQEDSKKNMLSRATIGGLKHVEEGTVRETIKEEILQKPLKATSELAKKMFGKFREKFSNKKDEEIPEDIQDLEKIKEIKEKVGNWIIEFGSQMEPIIKDKIKVGEKEVPTFLISRDGGTFYIFSGAYGQPLIKGEPEKAFEVPQASKYVDAHNVAKEIPKEKISKIICREQSGEIIHDFSLSDSDAPEFKVTEDGIVIKTEDEGESKEENWYLHTLYNIDGNRTENQHGYYSRIKPETIFIKELESIDFIKTRGDLVKSKRLELDFTNSVGLVKKFYRKLENLRKKSDEDQEEIKPKHTVQVKQWTVKIWDYYYSISNEDSETGVRKFYFIESDENGQPVITAESDLAFKVPQNIDYVDGKGEKINVPTENISGIICQNEIGGSEHRFSLSSPKAPEFKRTKDGIILKITNGKGKFIRTERWYLNVVFDKDGENFKNHDAYYCRSKPEKVRVLNINDWNFVA